MKCDFEVQIAASPEVVFRTVCDLGRLHEILSAVTKIEVLTEGPVGSGTRFRETRLMLGKEATEEMEFVEFDPPSGYSLLAESHGSRYTTTYRLAARDGGTHLHMHFHAIPQTIGARILSVLFRPLMGSVKREMARDLDELKAAVESAQG